MFDPIRNFRDFFMMSFAKFIYDEQHKQNKQDPKIDYTNKSDEIWRDFQAEEPERKKHYLK